jgi:uncharacterized membrane protein YeiH
MEIEISVFSVLDTLGTLAFAVSGATLAIKKRFDVFGVFVLAFVTAIGGGTVRDVLIGSTPVDWMDNSLLIITIITGGALSLLFNTAMNKMNYFVYLFDAAGLGLFTVAGIEKGMSYELNVFMCIALGTISATFGGLLRDIITGEKPMLLTRKEIYAIASAVGGGLYFILFYLDVPKGIYVPVSIIFVFVVRHLTHRYKITLPIVDENGKWTR